MTRTDRRPPSGCASALADLAGLAAIVGLAAWLYSYSLADLGGQIVAALDSLAPPWR